MARKRGVPTTLEDVTSKMKSGREYSVAELSKLCHLSEQTIRNVLTADRAITALDARRGEKGSGGEIYSLAGTVRTIQRHVDTRVRPDLTATLSGYDASLKNAQALAELSRRALTA